MKNVKTIRTAWYPEQSLLATTINGSIDLSDTCYWEQSLRDVLAQLGDDERFRIFVNMHGLQPENQFAGARLRMVVPKLLAAYGWKVGYMPMLGRVAQGISVRNTRGIACTGASHCHHNETLVNRCMAEFGTCSEQYFTEPALAFRWLEQLIPASLVIDDNL